MFSPPPQFLLRAINEQHTELKNCSSIKDRKYDLSYFRPIVFVYEQENYQF